MRFVIKQARPSGELWLVRMSARGVWGGHERARMFLNQANAEACLSKLQPGPGISLEIAPLGDSVSGISVLPNEGPSERGASQRPDDAIKLPDLTLISG